MWLEKGSASAGYEHIINGHYKNLVDSGIKGDKIVEVLEDTLINSNPIEIGRTAAGPYAMYLIKGKEYIVAFGDNGFIVNFYPKY